jgi:hypothetical protein
MMFVCLCMGLGLGVQAANQTATCWLDLRGIAANAPHVRFNPEGLSAATDLVWGVIYQPVPEAGTLAMTAAGVVMLCRRRV